MDLFAPLSYNILVKRHGFTFFVDINYKNLPHLCSQSNMVGHFIDFYNKVWFEPKIYDIATKEGNSLDKDFMDVT